MRPSVPRPFSPDPVRPVNPSGAAGNGADGPLPPSAGIDAQLAEALAVQPLLRDGLVRANNVLLALRQFRRQSRVVASALASLRELQGVRP